MDYTDLSTFNQQSSPTPTLTGAETTAILVITGIYGLFMLAVLVVTIVATWKIFNKAGQSGWKSLIPIYNAYILMKIIGRPGWWLLLFIIPIVNIVLSVIVAIDLGKSFGKSNAYSVLLLWLVSFIGYCMLAFSKDTYLGPGGASSTSEAQPSDSTPDPVIA